MKTVRFNGSRHMRLYISPRFSLKPGQTHMLEDVEAEEIVRRLPGLFDILESETPAAPVVVRSPVAEVLPRIPQTKKAETAPVSLVSVEADKKPSLPPVSYAQPRDTIAVASRRFRRGPSPQP